MLGYLFGKKLKPCFVFSPEIAVCTCLTFEDFLENWAYHRLSQVYSGFSKWHNSVLANFSQFNKSLRFLLLLLFCNFQVFFFFFFLSLARFSQLGLYWFHFKSQSHRHYFYDRTFIKRYYQSWMRQEWKCAVGRSEFNLGLFKWAKPAEIL